MVVNAMTAEIETGYDQRVHAVLQWADTTRSQSFLVAAAKIRSGNDGANGVQMFQKELRRNDNSHRGMFAIYELMIGYLAARDKMPDGLKKAVQDYLAVANFYRGDTENHLTMYYTGLYLAAQTFPDLPRNRWYTGKTSQENLREAENWLKRWMELTTTIGQGEFDSPTYMAVFIAPMFGLSQWAQDPIMKQNANLMLHWLIADYAVEHLNGVYVGAHSREYPERAIQPKHPASEMTYWGWLFFGQTQTALSPILLTAAMSDFQLPEVLYGIGTDRSQPYVHTETKRVRNIIRLGAEKNPPVYKYTYMTQDFALGSMMGGGILQPIQQHVWDLSFVSASPYQSIFTVHPYVGTPDLAMFFPEEMKFTIDEVARAHTYYGSEDKWASSSPFEQTFQHKNALIVLYNIPEGEKFGHIDGFFPKDLARREVDGSGWIFCQAGPAFLGYYPLQPYEWREDRDCFRLRSRHLKNGCVIEVAQQSDYPSFEAFKSQIRSNNLLHDTFDRTLSVSYTTSAGDVMTFAYDGPRLLNGHSIDFAEYKLFRGPFLNAQIGSRKLELLHHGKGVMLDMTQPKDVLILPVFTCIKIDQDFPLTGKLDHPAWQSAAAMPLVDAVTGDPGRFSTHVRLLFSDRYLYVGFHCQDDYIWGTVTAANGPIYDEECVEVFLNPSDVPHQYYEINLSPKNVLYQACVLNGRTAEQPDNNFTAFSMNWTGIRTAVAVDGEMDRPGKAQGWTAEYAIPLAELYGAPHVPPQAGDVWRANFYRIDSPQKDQREHYAWSKTGRPQFHRPWCFGYIKF